MAFACPRRNSAGEIAAQEQRVVPTAAIKRIVDSAIPSPGSTLRRRVSNEIRPADRRTSGPGSLVKMLSCHVTCH